MGKSLTGRTYGRRRAYMSENKFHNRKVESNGITFDSAGEFQRYNALLNNPEISELTRQWKTEIIPRVGKNRPTYYIADFHYFRDGKECVEDFKGFRTREYLIKRKIFMWRFPNITFVESDEYTV